MKPDDGASPNGPTPDGQGTAQAKNSKSRLVSIKLDQASIRRSSPNIEHEREVAIYDILDANHFAPLGRDDGPYALELSLAEDRLVLRISVENPGCNCGSSIVHMLSLSPFRRIIKDYFLVCESYYQAIRTAPPSRIQAIDMGRRGLHDEGSRVLMERLKDKVDLDHDTARRLFTLICALHWKG